MKKASLMLAIFISIFSFSHAQMRKKYNWGLSVAMNSIQAQVEIPLMTRTGVIQTGSGTIAVDADGNILALGDRVDNSFSYSLVPKYYINDDFLLRFDFGITNLKLKADYDEKNPLMHNLSTKEINTEIFRYTPGFQWIFMKEKKIESYCGMTISYMHYMEVKVDVYQESREISTDTIQSWLSKKETTPGGFSTGIGAFTGFSIFIHKKISLGAELSSSILYYKLGGITIGKNSEQVPLNPVDTYNTSFTNSYQGYKISKIISSFNFTVWF